MSLPFITATLPRSNDTRPHYNAHNAESTGYTIVNRGGGQHHIYELGELVGYSHPRRGTHVAKITKVYVLDENGLPDGYRVTLMDAQGRFTGMEIETDESHLKPIEPTTRPASHLPDPEASDTLRQFEEWAWRAPHHREVHGNPGFGELENVLVVATWGEKNTFNNGNNVSMQVDFGLGNAPDTVYDFSDDVKMQAAMRGFTELPVVNTKLYSWWEKVRILRHKESGRLSLFLTDLKPDIAIDGVGDRDVLMRYTLDAAFKACYDLLRKALAYTPGNRDRDIDQTKMYYVVDQLTLQDVRKHWIGPDEHSDATHYTATVRVDTTLLNPISRRSF